MQCGGGSFNCITVSPESYEFIRYLFLCCTAMPLVGVLHGSDLVRGSSFRVLVAVIEQVNDGCGRS